MSSTSVPADAPETSAGCFDPAAFAQMQRMVTDLGRMYRERNEALEEVSRAHHEALFRLALAAEYRDDDTGAHILRVGFIAEALALLAGMSAPNAAMLRKACLLYTSPSPRD